MASLLNGRDRDEYVLAAVRLDEAIAFRGVEPIACLRDCASQSLLKHRWSPILCAVWVLTISQCCRGLGRIIALRFGMQHFAGVFTMAIAEHTAFQSHLPIRSYDRWILLGYVAFAILAIVAIYFASTQPGFTEADLVRTVALP